MHTLYAVAELLVLNYGQFIIGLLFTTGGGVAVCTLSLTLEKVTTILGNREGREVTKLHIDTSFSPTFQR